MEMTFSRNPIDVIGDSFDLGVTFLEVDAGHRIKNHFRYVFARMDRFLNLMQFRVFILQYLNNLLISSHFNSKFYWILFCLVLGKVQLLVIDRRTHLVYCLDLLVNFLDTRVLLFRIASIAFVIAHFWRLSLHSCSLELLFLFLRHLLLEIGDPFFDGFDGVWGLVLGLIEGEWQSDFVLSILNGVLHSDWLGIEKLI